MGQPTESENTNEQGEDGGMAAALGDKDYKYTSAADEERNSDARQRDWLEMSYQTTINRGT